MRRVLGYILYLLALAITVLVVAAKYFNFGYPPVTPLLMSDPTRSLLIALALAFISKWF
jgi:hypothetical protein